VIDDEVWVASYHTLRVFDLKLRPIRDLTHPLMVGLHEVFPTDRGSIWVTATAIDAALEIDVTSGKARREIWPREGRSLQASLGLEPLDIDKTADNRTRFLESMHSKHSSHLHLNAVAEHDGEVYGLFNRFGAIVNLDREQVVVQDRAIRGGHNLVFSPDGQVHVSGTLTRSVLTFDLVDGKRSRELSLPRYPGLKRLASKLDASFRVKRLLYKYGWASMAPDRPFFVRGLSRYRNSLFVGMSPASILEIDDASGELIDLFHYRDDVRFCVHGLEVAGIG
jgi:hypothetical protein